MSYTRGAITKRIPTETWICTWCRDAGADEDPETSRVTMIGTHTTRQARELCRQALPSGVIILDVDRVAVDINWYQMTQAKFAALGDRVDPPVTIESLKED